MASVDYQSNRNRDKKKKAINAPFKFQVPSSLRDPQEETLTAEQLARLRSVDEARDMAVGYLHDPEQFASLWNTDKIHPETRRFMRKLVQVQTLNAVCNGFYRLPDKTKVLLDKARMRKAAENTQHYDNDYSYEASPEQCKDKQPVTIFVVDGDCLDAAVCLKNKDPQSHPVILNMASANSPGGGWRNGCGAQEENLHRRTNMFQCLEDPYHELETERDWQYYVPEFGGIYSPNVSVFRGSESNGYPFFPDGPRYFSFIACAAYAHPPTESNGNGEFLLSGKHLILSTKTKIEAILKIALENKHNALILSALGCGAYQNPPRHIAQLFREVIMEKYSHAFKYIVFAIIDDHNAMKSHNPMGNVQPFAEVFQTEPLTIETFAEALTPSTE